MFDCFILMYRHILIPLENSPADETILAHIKPLARMTGAKLFLVHVSDGWVARNFQQLKLAESQEMKDDRAYLETRTRELTKRASHAMLSWRSANRPTKSSSSPAKEMSI